MSIVDGEPIGTVFLLGGHSRDQGGLTAFPALPISVCGQQTRPHEDTRRSIRCPSPFSPFLGVPKAGGDELDADGVVSDIWLNRGEEEEDDACKDHDGG